MAASTNYSPLLSNRGPKAYRLEMQGRTLLLLLGLLSLSGIVVFALGMVTGMGLREPQAPPVSLTSTAPQGEEAVPEAESLAFNQGVKSPESTIEGLKVKQEQASGQTRALLERAQRELKLEEILPKQRQAATSNPPVPKREATRPQKQTPAAVVTQPAGPTYTIQVFSSRSRQNARELVERLKKQGFDAYMNQYQGANRKTWFRVRVGRMDRAGAERTVAKLKSEARLKAPRIIQR